MSQSEAADFGATFVKPGEFDRTHVEGEMPQARAKILQRILAGYLALLALTIVVPFVAVGLIPSGQVAAYGDLMLKVYGLSQGLFGILGVVVGYYFKESITGEPPT